MTLEKKSVLAFACKLLQPRAPSQKLRRLSKTSRYFLVFDVMRLGKVLHSGTLAYDYTVSL